MTHAKLLIGALVLLVIGFAGGFVARPMLAPTGPATMVGPPSPANPVNADARSVAYFMEHLDEARQIVAGCRAGTVRGDECANADVAIVRADSAERRKRFLGN